MHVLFVHQTYPSQFGPVVEWLSRSSAHRVTFLSADPGPRTRSVEQLHYEVPRQAAPERTVKWTRDFERHLRHCEAVVRALRKRPDVRPDLVVGHSGLGATLLIPEVLDCPIVSYFEYYMDPRRHDILDRADFEHPDWHRYWRRAANAVFLTDLEACRAGYSPTPWQRSLLPTHYQQKVEVIFDGIDTTRFRPGPTSRRIGNLTLPRRTRIVTYVARGFELIRGFDIFMKVASRIAQQYPDVMFVVAGLDQAAYGTDRHLIGGRSLKRWVLSRDDYHLEKFRFVGWLSAARLARLFNLTDLHIYLTTPFPLSWSVMKALACGATVLASDTAPVRDVITHGKNGLLADLFDVEGLTEMAVAVLRDPSAYRSLGRAAAEQVQMQYSTATVVPRLLEFFQKSAAAVG